MSTERPKTYLEKLQAKPMPVGAYKIAHEHLVIACHDVFIEYQKGLLLVTRDNDPVKNILWPVGGRITRGVSIEKSLHAKAKQECNLELKHITFLGCARTLFATDPFGHGHGTDTINFVYLARGQGKLKLDKLHKEPIIVRPENYTQKFRKLLHPYVRDFMDLAMQSLNQQKIFAPLNLKEYFSD